MTIEELQNRINDAADGLLTHAERLELENELNSRPDLLEEYRMIMALPDLGAAAGDLESYEDQIHLKQILNTMEDEELDSFQMHAIRFFRRYALAASLIFLALTVGFHFTAGQDAPSADEISFFIYSDASLSGTDYLQLIDQVIEN